MKSLSGEVSTFSADLHYGMYGCAQDHGVLLFQLLRECTDLGAASG